MTAPESCIYAGEVVHKRLRPVRHALRYKVFNVFADVDELPRLSRKLRLFSYNGRNVFSIRDSDHGPGDGTPISAHVRGLAQKHAPSLGIVRFFIFCYPRLFGYVFNPLTTYYGYDSEGRLRLMIYEVNNTFGGRTYYVLPSDGTARTFFQSCGKALHVSPFNRVDGHYGFHVAAPGENLSLGITLTTPEGPCLKAYFAGRRRQLSDWTLVRQFFAIPLLPLKVIGGIHLEAARLWLKGLKLQPRPPA
jgi:hypothetical protein